MTPTGTAAHSLTCATCGIPITGGHVCRADADRALLILTELPTWAAELAATASGIRSRHTHDRRPTRVHPPGVIDYNRLDLAARLDNTWRHWCARAWNDGCDDLRTAGAYFVVGWGAAPPFVTAMLNAEQAALGVLDPDERVLREARARQTQHAAGGRPRGVPDLGALRRRAASLRHVS